jgi:hypothetical protein
MLKCDKASRFISESMDRKLSLKELAPLRMHLYFCGKCDNYKRQLTALSNLLKIWNRKITTSLSPASPEALERIKKNLRR